MRRHYLLVALLGVVACGDSLYDQAGNGDLLARPVNASVQRLTRVPGRNAGGGNGEYWVRNNFLTACEPYQATAAGSVSPRKIRLVLTAGPGPACDAGMAGTFGYEARIPIPDEFASALGNWHPVWAIHHFTDGRPSDSSEVGAVVFSPPPPQTAPAVTVSGRLEPADSTIKSDLVVLYFETSRGDSGCTPTPHYQYGEHIGIAVSDHGAFSGELTRWAESQTIVCVVAYGYRNWQPVLLTPRPVRMDFSQADSVTIDAILPAGPGSWQRDWRP